VHPCMRARLVAVVRVNSACVCVACALALLRPYESRAKLPMARAAASWVSTSLYVRHLRGS
jgi:hypothetical protein